MRPVEELQSITDCVEEILFVVTHRSAIVGLVRDEPGEHPGELLYDEIEAIVTRAHHLGAGLGSPLRKSPNERPPQPPSQRQPH